MNDKHGYWKDKYEMARIANFLTSAREIKEINTIKWCCENTIIYDESYFNYGNNEGINIPPINLYPMSTTEALLKLGYNSGRQACILNFASFKHPGGMYLKGSTAQEESLCQKSILYNVLSRFDECYYKINRRDVNKSLYYNRALYTPGIKFTFHVSDNESIVTHADVITCAAPNYRSAKRYYNITRETNSIVLENRIKYILNILSLNSNRFDVLILGAFGCGVFGQDPDEVSKLFMKNIKMFKWDNRLKEIAFAVPNPNNEIAHNNFMIFYNNITNRCNL